MRRIPTWALAAATLLVLCLVIAYAASRPEPWRPPVTITPTQTPSSTATGQPSTTSPPPSAATARPDLDAAVAALEQQYNTRLGLAIAPVAAPGHVTTQPWVGGSLTTAPAWGTIDVPVGLAVARAPTQPNNLTYLLDHSIAQGSDAGDQALWQFLGTPDQATAATSAVLHATGDDNTTLPPGTTTDAAPVFTQTWWASADAAQFMAVAHCMSGSWPVLFHMTSGGDSFGLASIQNALVKTSMGDVQEALYRGQAIRQVGLLRLQSGRLVGVSLAAQAQDGTATTAQGALTALAELLPGLTGFNGTCI